MAIGVARRDCLWFGTLQKSLWFQTPNAGADMSPTGWNSDGTLLNGGNYVFGSWGSGKQYVFEWQDSSQSRTAQLLKSFADGTYGRGLIYFQTPNSYELNVLPAGLADPSMGVGHNGLSLVYGVEPTGTPTTSGPNDLPVVSATYNLNNTPEDFRGEAEAIYVPIPDGYTLLLGAFYSQSGDGGVFYTEQLSTGSKGNTVQLTPLSSTASNICPDAIGGIPGVWVWVGRDGTANSSVTLQALTGRLMPSADYSSNPNAVTRVSSDPWVGGMGNSGCRFVGKPTYVENGPNQTGFACTLKEVGFWAYG